MEKMNKFQRAAQKAGSLSPLMEGRGQITTEDLKGKTVTIMAFDLPLYHYQSGEEKRIPILVFKEYPGKYYMGNPMMYDLCKAWADLYDGDIEAAYADLAEAGGFQFHF